MNIAYITLDYPHDKSGWSGLTYHIGKSLADAGNHLEYIYGMQAHAGPILRLKQKIYPKLTGKFIQPNRYPSFYRQHGLQASRKLQEFKNLDLVFSNSSECIVALDTKLPMAYWVDACFAGMVGYYPEFGRLHPETIKAANRLEQLAFDKSKYVFFSSDWAAETALRNYNVDERKIKVIPFGANLDRDLSEDEIVSLAKSKDFNTCKLLFLGAYWERKGGTLAVQVAQALDNAGIPTELIIGGCTPFTEQVPSFVRQEGFLSKNDPDQKRKLDDLFKEAHFLIVPSQAECYGLVYCEANSYGLPALGTNTGGIPTIIKENINGETFDIDASADKYVSFIEKIFLNKELYRKLSLSSFIEYKQRLNWKVAGNEINKILESVK